MKLKKTQTAMLSIALTATLALAACGGDDEDTPEPAGSASAPAAAEVSGTIAGAGSSAQGSAMEAWIAGFTEANPDATVTYDPAGSGAGRTQFTEGGVQFAGSDAYLKPEEVTKAQEQCGGDFVEFPGYISPIAVAYNLPGVEDLKLSASVIAKIFDGKITKWNDPAIAGLNSGTTLPDSNITPVHRSDESGTTQNFTDYLHKAAPADWTYDAAQEWPVSGGEGANGTSGVAETLKGGEGTIGYLDASRATDLGVAHIQVGSEFVEYTPEAAAAVVDAGKTVSGRPQYSFAIDIPRDTTEAGVYPIVLVSYTLACTKYDDQATADTVKAYLTYVVSEEGQAAAAENAGSAPISDTQRTNALKGIAAIGVA
ncbi:phosphate ABC transporter substrate-binding protein PstS [Frankia nepalensis]|uniref:phosphate ABC transporter substrate-binding protein PstS n=1 Tax=Frankia nepalensis TaxID=1836974 RepID=UPI0027DCA96F|nr:phosphate ABC transporter substrate-binding protein PstS [Frankia nepalensis]